MKNGQGRRLAGWGAGKRRKHPSVAGFERRGCKDGRSGKGGRMLNAPEISPAMSGDYVRHHCHDVRNRLNAIELECMLLLGSAGGGAGGSGISENIASIRRLAASVGELVQRLNVRCRPPHWGEIDLSALVDNCRQNLSMHEDCGQIDWKISGHAAVIQSDAQSLGVLIRESAAAFFGAGGGGIDMLAGDEAAGLRMTLIPQPRGKAPRHFQEKLPELAAAFRAIGGVLCYDSEADRLTLSIQPAGDSFGPSQLFKGALI